MPTLALEPKVKLPIEAVTSTIAILGKKGSGKTYTAKKLAELMLKAGFQVVILDIVGAWWGLKSSADGKSAGFSIPILGGKRADVPLVHTAGEVTARAIVEGGFSCIIDIGQFSKTQRHQFAAPFLETLYMLNEHAMHLMVDEADFYAPQKTFTPQSAQTLGAMDELVRRGRQRGVGVSLISQRPQVLNKDVLTQADLLIALRFNHPRDIDAIMEWVRVKADPGQAKQMLDSLPGLPTGDFWAWAPDTDLFVRGHADPAHTFDSSATPKPGQRHQTPKVLADIDVAKLGERIKATVEEQKANDPRALKARIAQMEQDMQRMQQRANTQTDSADLIAVRTELSNALTALGQERNARESIVQILNNLLVGATSTASALAGIATEARSKVSVAIEQAKKTTPTVAAPAIVRAKPMPAAPFTMSPSAFKALSNGNLPAGERTVLTALAQYPAGMERPYIGAITGYTKISTRNAYIQRLQQKGYATGTDRIHITEAGAQALGPYEPLPRGKELLRWWLERLPEGEAKVLQVLAAEDEGLSREEISERTGYTATSTRNAYIQRLAQKRLVVADSAFVLISDVLR